MGFVYLAVDCIGRKKLFVRSDGVDTAAVHYNDAVGVLDRGNPLRDDKLRRTRNFIPERFPNHRIRFGIDGGSRVVENQDFRLFEQCARDAKPLLLTAGYVCAAALYVGIVTVRKSRDKFIRAGKLTNADQLLVGSVRIAPA